MILNVNDLNERQIDLAVALHMAKIGEFTFDKNESVLPGEAGRPYCSVVNGQVHIWGYGVTQPGTFNRETGKPWVVHGNGGIYSPTRKWLQGGEIIDEFDIWVRSVKSMAPTVEWMNDDANHKYCAQMYDGSRTYSAYGPSFLVSAMKCFIVSKYGETIDLPDQYCEDGV